MVKAFIVFGCSVSIVMLWLDPKNVGARLGASCFTFAHMLEVLSNG